MSMTKMDCVCDYAWDQVTLDGKGQYMAEALNAGNTALDLLTRLYWISDGNVDIPEHLEKMIVELIEEWNE